MLADITLSNELAAAIFASVAGSFGWAMTLLLRVDRRVGRIEAWLEMQTLKKCGKIISFDTAKKQRREED